MAEDTVLKIELEYFEFHRRQWCKSHLNEYALISDERLLGFFIEWIKGFEYGCAHVGVRKPFLLKQILEHDPVFFPADPLRRFPKCPTCGHYPWKLGTFPAWPDSCGFHQCGCKHGCHNVISEQY